MSHRFSQSWVGRCVLCGEPIIGTPHTKIRPRHFQQRPQWFIKHPDLRIDDLVHLRCLGVPPDPDVLSHGYDEDTRRKWQ